MTNNLPPQGSILTKFWNCKYSFFFILTSSLVALGLYDEYSYICSPFSETSIRSALKLNRIKTFKDLFLQEQITPNDVIVIQSGHTPIHETITLNKRDIFKLAMLYKADVNKKDNRGITPLMKAAALGRVQMMKTLLEGGADLNIQAPNGETALDKAKLYDRWEAIELLEEYAKKGKQENKNSDSQ